MSDLKLGENSKLNDSDINNLPSPTYFRMVESVAEQAKEYETLATSNLNEVSKSMDIHALEVRARKQKLQS
jgi:hypothetical protein